MAISPRGYYDLGRVFPRLQTRQSSRHQTRQSSRHQINQSQQTTLSLQAASYSDSVPSVLGVATVNVHASVTAGGNITRNAAGSLDAHASVTAVGNIIHGLIATITSHSTLTSLAKVMHGAAATISSHDSIIAGSVVQHAAASIEVSSSTLTATSLNFNQAHGFSTGIRFHLKLNEGTGTSQVADVCGSTAAMSGFSNSDWITSSLPGILGDAAALTFDGTNNYLTLPDVFDFSAMKSISISVWFKTSSHGGILGQNTERTPGGSKPDGYVPAVYVDTAGILRTSVFWHEQTAAQNLSLATVNDGSWHHLLVTYGQDIVGGVERQYLDGVLQGQQYVGQTSYSSTYNYWLGVTYNANWPNGVGWDFFNGVLDDFRVYSTELSAAQAVVLASGNDIINQAGKATMSPLGSVITAPYVSTGGVVVDGHSLLDTFSQYGRFDLMDVGL